MGQMAAHKTSAVCQYFDAENENQVECRLCPNELVYNHLTDTDTDTKDLFLLAQDAAARGPP